MRGRSKEREIDREREKRKAGLIASGMGPPGDRKGPSPSRVSPGILKSRDITLPAKVCLVEAIVFPVVMYGCESWTVKKAER